MLSIVLVALLVAPGVHVIRGDFVPGTQPDGNTVIFETADGLVVVDTGRHSEHTKKIVEFAQEARKPVAAIVNTHWHLDHVGGNILLKSEYPKAKVYGSDAIRDARKGFLANYRKQLEEMLARTSEAEKQKPFRAEMALIDGGAQFVPDVVVSSSGKRSFGRRKLEINFEPRAVTAGDLWLFDARTRVLVAGDLITLPSPFLDTACPAGWKLSLDRLARTDFEILIPGHGAPMTRGEFDTYRAAFNDLLRCSASEAGKEECVNGWMSAAGSLLGETDAKFTRLLTDYYVDVLRRPSPHCAD
jgi:glyoxylase-like metal-dependent hydrolase (beta-lactamase superfamily II)